MTGILLGLFAAATLVLLFFIAFCFIRGQTPIPRSPETAARHRFAVLIPARNEEAVIENLVDSLMRQDYPRECYDVYVIVNNSTDRTAALAEAAGAKILRPDGPVSSKGEALRFAFSALRDGDAEAYVIFDADNVVDRGFLSEMNRQYESGAEIVQGRRSGKNARKNLLTGCYEVFYVIQNVYYDHSLSVDGNSCALNGTGWMIRRSWLEEHGFPMVTMTEDLELTAMAVSGSGRIAYAHDAVTYDEYPETVRMAARQLTRWCFGQAECMRGYAGRLFSSFLRRGSFSGFCMSIVFTSSVTMPLYFVLAVLAVRRLEAMGAVPALGAGWFLVLLAAVWLVLLPNVRLAYAKRNETPLAGTAAVLAFPFFMLGWIPLAIGSLFRREAEWKPVEHRADISIEERERMEPLPRGGFLSLHGQCRPSGMRSVGHWLLLISTIAAIVIALNHTLLLSVARLRRLIRSTAVIMWLLEGTKIAFKLGREKERSPDTWMPLYFCSVALYASLLSGFAGGALQRVGDVFLATGGLCAGVCFLAYPSSSLLLYPAWHFCSLHSFLYHGWMVYLGVLVSRSGLVSVELADFPAYFLFCLCFCLLAQAVNRRSGANLMFLCRPFPGTFLTRLSGRLKGAYAPAVMLAQIVLPFFAVLAVRAATPILTRPDWYPPAT